MFFKSLLRTGIHASSSQVMAIFSSSNCFCSTAEGAPIITSYALLFIGNGIISRILSSPASSMTIRSMPGAIPACGGAP